MVSIYGLQLKDLNTIEKADEKTVKTWLKHLFVIKSRLDEHPEYPEIYITQSYWAQVGEKMLNKNKKVRKSCNPFIKKIL